MGPAGGQTDEKVSFSRFYFKLKYNHDKNYRYTR
nr:MAG TPA: hypothetical protein [Caudoviricetes sp.]